MPIACRTPAQPQKRLFPPSLRDPWIAERFIGPRGFNKYMDASASFCSGLIAPYGPTVPLGQLVERLNRLYHAAEAVRYDEAHPEIHASLPPLWERMIDTALANDRAPQWSVLDFGCGTGFEAEQLLARVGDGKIQQLVCYDPSPEMLAECRRKIAPRCPHAIFLTDLEALAANDRPFNVLLTNSLLHHLPNPWETIDALLPRLSEDAVWLQGHEPSKRYRQNRRCGEVYDAYRRHMRWRRLLMPSKYISRLRDLLRADSPATFAARESHRLGLFLRRPPSRVITALVDYHVPASAAQVAAGRGFDFEDIHRHLGDGWTLKWVQTYSFMGNIPERLLSKPWRKRADELRHRFPMDGGIFCCVWKRG